MNKHSHRFIYRCNNIGEANQFDCYVRPKTIHCIKGSLRQNQQFSTTKIEN